VIDRACAVNFLDREKWRRISLVLLLRLAFAGRDGRISAVPSLYALAWVLREAWPAPRGCVRQPVKRPIITFLYCYYELDSRPTIASPSVPYCARTNFRMLTAQCYMATQRTAPFAVFFGPLGMWSVLMGLAVYQ
jgi:hypothetical protein